MKRSVALAIMAVALLGGMPMPELEPPRPPRPRPPPPPPVGHTSGTYDFDATAFMRDERDKEPLEAARSKRERKAAKRRLDALLREEGRRRG